MKGLVVLFAVLLTACATAQRPVIHDPVTFLNQLKAIGEGTCNEKVRCVLYEGEDKNHIYVAIYWADNGVLLAIKRLGKDGKISRMWERKPQPRNQHPIAST